MSLGNGKCGDNGTGVKVHVHVATRKEEGATTVRSEDIIRQESQTS